MIQLHDKELKRGALRLLCLARDPAEAPGAIAAHPKWQLSTHSLIDCPPYVALSYAWHEPYAVQQAGDDPRRQVFVNGHATAVTSNLFYALQHLASKHHGAEVDHYWVDALCINQTSEPERAAQVSIMHRIYREAAAVLVWLGPDPEEDAYVVRETFRALLQKFNIVRDPALLKPGVKQYPAGFLNSGRNDHQALRDAGLPPLFSNTWRKVLAFWDRAWFRRVWVQQEVASGKHASFWCGELEFTTEELVECSGFFVRSGLAVTLMTLRIADSSEALDRVTVTGRRIGVGASRIKRLRQHMRGHSLEESWDERHVANAILGPALVKPDGKVENFLLRGFVVALFLSFQDDCSDPRDRIFTLQVLTTLIAEAIGETPLSLEADYSKSMTTIFAETTAWLIETAGWLGMLALLYPQQRMEDRPCMPSWVPDFRAPPPAALLMFDPAMEQWIKTRSAQVSNETRPAAIGPSLRVSARRVGVVRDVGNSYEENMEDGMFEATAELLLEIPAEIWPEYSRIDHWMDTMDCKLVPTFRADHARRSRLRHYVVFAVLRKMSKEVRAGRISRGRDLLPQMPHLEALAQADVTRTLPTWHEWATTYQVHPDKQEEILTARPEPFPHFRLRRVFRLVDLGFPHCPAAPVLAIGPDAIMPGDEVFEVAGAVMPMVFRRAEESADHSLPRARVLGEAFSTAFNEMYSRMGHLRYERWELV